MKQAEIFGEVRDQYGLARDDDFKLTDYPTITKLAAWLTDRAASTSDDSGAEAPTIDAAPRVPPAPVAPAREAKAEDEETSDAPTPTIAAPMLVTGSAALDVLVELISQKTGYSVDELDPTYELEADLGIDTVKQAEIFGEVRDRFSIPKDDDFKLADYATIEKLAAWLDSKAAPTNEPTAKNEPKAATKKAATTPTIAAPAPLAPGSSTPCRRRGISRSLRDRAPPTQAEPSSGDEARCRHQRAPATTSDRPIRIRARGGASARR